MARQLWPLARRGRRFLSRRSSMECRPRLRHRVDAERVLRDEIEAQRQQTGAPHLTQFFPTLPLARTTRFTGNDPLRLVRRPSSACSCKANSCPDGRWRREFSMASSLVTAERRDPRPYPDLDERSAIVHDDVHGQFFLPFRVRVLGVVRGPTREFRQQFPQRWPRSARAKGSPQSRGRFTRLLAMAPGRARDVTSGDRPAVRVTRHPLATRRNLYGDGTFRPAP